LARRLGYGVGDMAGSIGVTITGFFLYAFLLDVAGVRPGAVGLIFLISNIWDAIIDPYIGYLSDRTRSRWGGKRVWLLFGAVPVGLTYVLTWVAPPLNDTGLFFYYLVILLLFKTASSSTGIPYLALTAGMAKTYNDRTQLNTYRSILNITASLLAIVLHPMLVSFAGDDVRLGHIYSAGFLGCLMALSILIAFRSSFETDTPSAAPKLTIFHDLQSALRNRPFLIATGIFLCSWVVVMLVQNNLQLYVRYWANAEALFLPVILVFQVTAIGSIAFWGAVSRRIDKKFVYILGVLIWATGLTALFFAPRESSIFYFIAAFVIALGLAVAYIVPWSMLPDTVDYDELQTGQRREGSFYGIFVLLQQIGLSVGLAASGFALEAAGYINPEVAGQVVTQPAAVENTLRILVSFVPVTILLLSIPLALTYPITRERFAHIRRELEIRHEAGS
jgi:GPH family glycoside/pentoside/hexuronide:cation symporter